MPESETVKLVDEVKTAFAANDADRAGGGTIVPPRRWCMEKRTKTREASRDRERQLKRRTRAKKEALIETGPVFKL